MKFNKTYVVYISQGQLVAGFFHFLNVGFNQSPGHHAFLGEDDSGIGPFNAHNSYSRLKKLANFQCHNMNSKVFII